MLHTCTRLSFICLMALLMACSPDGSVKIGFLGGMSGRSADLGVAGRNGVMLAVEQQNAAGGIKGRPIELLAKDDAQNHDTARTAVTELLTSKVEIIIGPMTSSIAMAVLPQINSTTTILLSPTVTTTLLTGKDDHFFRVCGDTSNYSIKAARFQFQKHHRRTAMVLYDQNNRAYTESWLNDFRTEYEKLGGRILSAEGFQSGDQTVFLDQVRRGLRQKPELVLIVANAVDAAMISQQVRKVKPDQALALAEWAATERFIELAGSAGDETHVSQFIDRTNRSERYLAFHKAYRERFGQEPGFAGLAGYDAAQVAMQAYLQRSQGEPLKATITRIGRFQGAQQEVQIDQFGDTQRQTHISVVRNGRFMTLE